MTLENLEGVTDDAVKALYVKQDDGTYRLDVEGHHDKNDDPNRIPKSRLDAEIEKRKASDASLMEVAESFVESVPEEYRDIIPNSLSPAATIKFIQQANAKGLFDAKPKDSIDTKKPGDKAPKDYSGLSPQAIMAQGYKTK
jgi:hypothetical protein